MSLHASCIHHALVRFSTCPCAYYSWWCLACGKWHHILSSNDMCDVAGAGNSLYGEHLVGHMCQQAIKGTLSVGCHYDQLVVKVIYVSDLALQTRILCQGMCK